MFENKAEKQTKAVREIRDIQMKSIAHGNPDDYMIGLYNGLELALAVMEGREPDFESCVAQTEVIEGELQEQELKRTSISGTRRRTQQ